MTVKYFRHAKDWQLFCNWSTTNCLPDLFHFRPAPPSAKLMITSHMPPQVPTTHVAMMWLSTCFAGPSGGPYSARRTATLILSPLLHDFSKSFTQSIVPSYVELCIGAQLFYMFEATVFVLIAHCITRLVRVRVALEFAQIACQASCFPVLLAAWHGVVYLLDV